MSATGIGAAVRRKEDQPLHHRQGPLHRRHQPARARLRLFHPLAARARQDQDDRRQAAAKMPGVAGVFTGAEFAARQARQSDLRLDGAVERRLADEDGAARGARRRQGQLCRRCGRGRDRRYAGAGARMPPKKSSSITRCCPPSSIRPAPQQGRAAHSRSRAEQHDLQLASSATPTRPTRRSRTPSTSPNSNSSTTGWCRTPWSRARRSAEYDCGERPSDFVERDAESARRAARHCRLRRHGA